MYFERCKRLYSFRKPTIAAVQGACVAAGLMLACMCDLIVAADDATFSNPVLRMTGAGVELLVEPWELGIRKAKEFLWTGETIDAQEAWRLGLVNRVVPRAELIERVESWPTGSPWCRPTTAQVVKDTLNNTATLMGKEASWKYHFMAHHWMHNTETAASALGARKEKSSMSEVFAEHRTMADRRADPPLRSAGLRVIDVGTRISAPFCAGLLGDMGAEVIKVEDPRGGDFMRTIGPFVPTPTTGSADYSMWWAVEGRGRKGVTLDLRQPAGQDLFRRLAATPTWCARTSGPAPWRPGASAPTTATRALVWARISVFGQDGPYSGRTGLDRMGIAYGGLLHLTGYPDRPPVRPGVPISDYLTGDVRRLGGDRRPLPPDATRRGDGAGRRGRRPPVRVHPAHPGVDHGRPGPPRADPRARGQPDGQLGSPRQLPHRRRRATSASWPGPTPTSADCARPWAAPTWPTTPSGRRWPNGPPRSDEINDLVADWTRRSLRPRVEARCIAHEVPVGTAYERRRHPGRPPHGRPGRPGHGRRPGRRPPSASRPPSPGSTATRPAAPAPAPALGEHNDEVWCDLVGLSADELAALQSAGVV